MSTPVFLAGPTAVGKSEIALALAAKMGGEIISVDSMQVYRGLDIGTAKPDAAARKLIPHHLHDVCDLTEPFDAAKFAQLASVAVAEIRARNRVPIFCGGTGFYFKAYLDGVGNSPAPDARFRAELEASPLARLLEELRERDPDAYVTIDRKNPRRIIRAVEIVRATGKPIAASRARWARQPHDAPGATLTLFVRAPGDLRRRIDSRVDEMFRRGLVEETHELLRRGLEKNRAAMQAIGYRQVAGHLRGEHTLAETIELVKIRTRQFAKRQMTWFRRHAHYRRIEIKPEDTVEEIATRIFV
ncbi:MAG: tRNA (adenosine(37)-N6)-dimethylallyltransferase MiaA [Limisphaerales bacterium]